MLEYLNLLSRKERGINHWKLFVRMKEWHLPKKKLCLRYSLAQTSLKDNSKSSKTAKMLLMRRKMIPNQMKMPLSFHYLMTIQISWNQPSKWGLQLLTDDQYSFLEHFDHLFTFLHCLTIRFCAHYSFFGLIRSLIHQRFRHFDHLFTFLRGTYWFTITICARYLFIIRPYLITYLFVTFFFSSHLRSCNCLRCHWLLSVGARQDEEDYATVFKRYSWEPKIRVCCQYV